MDAISLQAKKSRGDKIVVLTCYDFPTASWQEEAGVDVIFVGDSVGTNVLGYSSEHEVTMEDMIHHLKAVKRGVRDAYLLADLPYRSYETPEQGLGNALRLCSLGAQGIKIEGVVPEVVRTLSARGIDAWAHLGLNPQQHDKKRYQAKTAQRARRLLEDALRLEEAGASFLVLELVPEEVGRAVSEQLSIPTIGIGAGRYTDGQVLVLPDLLGMAEPALMHAVRYAETRASAIDAMSRYAREVREGIFPSAEHVRHLEGEELRSFEESPRR